MRRACSLTLTSMLLGGCFYSHTPLVTRPTTIMQMEEGIYAQMLAVSEKGYTDLTPTQQARCQTLERRAGQTFCDVDPASGNAVPEARIERMSGKRVRVTLRETYEVLTAERIADNLYTLDIVFSDEPGQHWLAILRARGKYLEVYAPDCKELATASFWQARQEEYGRCEIRSLEEARGFLAPFIAEIAAGRAVPNNLYRLDRAR
jgi:hypothetical protein